MSNPNWHPRPHLPRAGLLGLMRSSALLLMALNSAAMAGRLHGTVVDAELGTPVPGAAIRAAPLIPPDRPNYHSSSDSSGAFSLDLAAGTWLVRVEAFGYQRSQLELRVGEGETTAPFRLQSQPLVMDELLVRARRTGEGAHSPAFVESIPVTEAVGGIDVAEVLEEAVGVSVRRYGGLGSYSAISIRGSTAEQVQIYLDGVPLNRATGGGVDLGSLPLHGVEVIDVYRGAVPGRFGGNSIGGVVHIRTRAARGRRQSRVELTTGSLGTRQLSGSIRRRWHQVDVLSLVDYSSSDNDFEFLDDNGTEYNAADDERVARANSDFGSLRVLVKAARPWGEGKLLAHNTLDVSHKGIPGLGNFQSLHTRFDTWRSATELEAFGALSASGRSAYRLSVHHVLQQEDYKDLLGEVGTGTQHNRQITRTLGFRGEVSALLPHEGLATTFAGLSWQIFDPRDLLSRNALPESRRMAASLGTEVELALAQRRLRLNAGAQVDVLDDRLFNEETFTLGGDRPARQSHEWQRGIRVGFQWSFDERLSVQGHLGRYQRPPSFFELFGDRGAVVGNTDLVSEESSGGDVGLVFRGSREKASTAVLQLVEVTYYRNSVDNLIRFIQNSQVVSKPHNIGGALLQGVELRTQVRLHALAVGANYVYQRAENRAPFAFEQGNDLPNAPRHTVAVRAGLWGRRLRYGLSLESRHFLDRANLRSVPRRSIHSFGGGVPVGSSTELGWEVKNATDNQIADLWGFPLPGRAYFISLRQDLDALLRR